MEGSAVGVSEAKVCKTFQINNRRYLGNKYKLLPFITGVVEKECAGIETVAIYDQYADHEHEAIKALADHYIENYGQALKTLQKDWP